MNRFMNLVSAKVFLAGAVLLSTLAWGGGAVRASANTGAVYTITNAASGNAVLVYDRATNGALTYAGSYATGGLGSGGGLGSQGSVVLSQDNRSLYTVNAGSNDISAFAIKGDALNLTGMATSGGVMPISLTVHKSLLYVLNAGGTGNISGFWIGNDGSLTPIAGSTRPLSSGAAGPAQVQFSPDGGILAVTEKNTNMIDTYTVNSDGTATGPFVHPSSGPTPFGFSFGKGGKLLVSEAFGGAANASAASSYIAAPDGSLTVVSASSPTHQTAACWLVLTGNERYAYTANAGSDSISGYAVGKDASLTLLNPDGRTATTGPGSHPIDMALSNNSHYLYVLTTFAHGISAFQVQADGNLVALDGVAGLPASAAGLASR